MEVTNYYTKKGQEYFSYFREDVFAIIKKNGKFKRVLEVGCGSGILLHTLKEEGIAEYTVGLEPYAQLMSENNIDKHYPDSVENAFSKLKTSEKFDLIIFADVLEHLQDPWSILNQSTAELLEDNGIVIISIPNFRNIFTLAKIIFTGSFKYVKEGVLDKTHLRFFCKKDIVHLANNAQLDYQFITPSFKYKQAKFFSRNRIKYINLLTLNLFSYWLSNQIIIVGKKRK